VGDRNMQDRRRLAVISGLGLMLSLGACTAFPRAGPDDQRIVREAAVRVGDKDRKVGIDYVLLDLTQSMLPYFQEGAASSLKSGFGTTRGGPPGTILGVGDVVQVSIFESAAGGLFI